MRRLFVLMAVLMVSLASMGQEQVDAKFAKRIGHGVDSVLVIESLSLYQKRFDEGSNSMKSGDKETARQKYDQALDAIEYMIDKAPYARVEPYQKGALICEYILSPGYGFNLDEASHKAYYDRLMWFLQKRIDNRDSLNTIATKMTMTKKGSVLCRMAADYKQYSEEKNDSVAYAMFKEGIDETGYDTEAYVLNSFMFCSYKVNLENHRKESDYVKTYLQDIMLVQSICDTLLALANDFPTMVLPADTTSADSSKWVETVILDPEAEKIIQAYTPVSEATTEYLSYAGDCNSLEKIYATKIEENKGNLAYLKSVIDIFAGNDCDSVSTVYALASDYAYQIEKNPNAAVGKGKRLLQEGDINGAKQYFEEAISIETDPLKKANYSYLIGATMYKKGNLGECRRYCSNALKFNPKLGVAYLLIASCIARQANGGSETVKEMIIYRKSLYYCLATDYCNKAMTVDPSCGQKAQKQIRGYAALYFPKSEAFMMGKKMGQVEYVAGEKTTLRLR